MNLFKVVASLVLDSSDYDAGLTSGEKKAKSFAQKAGGVMASAGKLTAIGIGAASTAVVAFGKNAVSTGMQFDSAMSQVAATMGLTSDQITELRDFAQEMGATTAFSATQAAEALNYMALAGYDADTSMKMLPNVLNLAAAGNMSLATASDMVTDAQSALGLSMGQTNVLVDQMAIAASKSNTSVAQLGDAILTVGGTAKMMSGGTTELSTALGILADNGIKGSEGGTALRNILLSLSSPTSKAKDALEAFGGAEKLVYDEAGNMRSLNDIFSDLNAITAEMTQKERTELLSTMFNKRDLKSAEALLANAGARFSELSGYIDSANPAPIDKIGKSVGDIAQYTDSASENFKNATSAAKQMAGTQLDNLAGDITLFNSALEGAKIKVSDKLTPSLREMVSFGSKAVTTLSDAFAEGGLSGVMDALGDLVVDGIAMLTEHLPEIVTAGMSLLGALAQGIIENLPLIASTVLDIIIQIANSIGESLPELLPSIIDAILQIAQTLIDHLPELLNAVLTIIVGLAEGIVQSLPIIIEKLPDLITGIVDFLIEAMPLIIDAGIQLLGALIDNLPAILDAINEAIPDLISGIIESILEHLPELIQAGIDLFVALVESLPEIIAGIVEAIPSIITGIVDGFVEHWPEIKQAGLDLFNKIGEGLKETWEKAKEWGKDLIKNFTDGIKEKWNNLKEKVGNVAQGIKDFLGFSEPKKGPLSNFHTYAPDMIKLFVKGIDDNMWRIDDALKRLPVDALTVDATATGVGARNVAITQNIYAERMTPAMAFEQAREQQELLDWMGRGSFEHV